VHNCPSAENWFPGWRPFHSNLLVFSSQPDFQLITDWIRVRVRVTDIWEKGWRIVMDILYFIKPLTGLTHSSRNKYCKYRSRNSRYAGKDWYLEWSRRNAAA
jgi:hypothetical protein